MTYKRNSRITVDLQIMLGKPIIKGTRITVEHVLRLLAGGLSSEQIVEEHPRLTRDDVLAAIDYAADTVAMEDVELV